jgi:hypothetical protein
VPRATLALVPRVLKELEHARTDKGARDIGARPSPSRSTNPMLSSRTARAPYLRKMLKRAILSAAMATVIAAPIALLSGCGTEPLASSAEPPPDESEVSAPLSVAEQDAQDIREADFLDALLTYQSHDKDITLGGHCNVRLMECDPYPIGKGKHRRADAMCSSVCLDTIAHCEDYKPAELEYCCAHPDANYHDASGREYPDKHCMPSGEPNWSTHCTAGLNP